MYEVRIERPGVVPIALGNIYELSDQTRTHEVGAATRSGPKSIKRKYPHRASHCLDRSDLRDMICNLTALLYYGRIRFDVSLVSTRADTSDRPQQYSWASTCCQFSGFLSYFTVICRTSMGRNQWSKIILCTRTRGSGCKD